MAKRLVTTILIIGTMFISCKKRDCFTSAGEVKSEVRLLGAVRKIDIYNYFNVYLKNDTVNKIEIEAGQNLIPNIETTIVDSVLIIKDLNACGFLKGYKDKNLYISVDTLKEVALQDGANLYSMDTLKFSSLRVYFLSDIGFCDLTVDCNTIALHAWFCSGDYILRGKTDYLYFDIEYLAFGYAEDLEAKSAYVFNKSMGDCYVNVTEQLRAFIKDEGSIYYTGNPSKVTLEEDSGTGKLVNYGQ